MNTDREKPSLRAFLVYTFSAQAIKRMPLSPILVLYFLTDYSGPRIILLIKIE